MCFQCDILIFCALQVLVLMSTDYGTVKEGFELSYEASYCPRKCSGVGTCGNGKCSCHSFHKGEYCETEWCPSNCNQATSRGFCGSVSYLQILIFYLKSTGCPNTE